MGYGGLREFLAAVHHQCCVIIVRFQWHWRADVLLSTRAEFELIKSQTEYELEFEQTAADNGNGSNAKQRAPEEISAQVRNF
jgi:hypothetical protein